MMLTDETIDIAPYVVARARDERLELVEVRREGMKALPVFCNEMDAARFMMDADHNPYDGFRPLPMDHETIAGVMALLDFSHVALSEEWTGANSVALIKGDDFVKMLAESPRGD